MQGFSPIANALGTVAYTIRSPTEEVRPYVHCCVCVSVFAVPDSGFLVCLLAAHDILCVGGGMCVKCVLGVMFEV